VVSRQHNLVWASTSWNISDVMAVLNLCPTASEEFLSRNDRAILEAMTQAGWDAILDQAAAEGIELKDDENFDRRRLS